ncbi:similar to Saccharomyces cerevisiae YIL126W STH1 ATPase component of the RSC chromatin remodeling complex [Maudiozyma saulgeensis]|uniref:Similar to Saccharomyces cerevisiae YIL126W STH1 ATPase component of the RSC chromatin remodeling complex n=1 Tax=Maudiozyma saulgeensis TaxID=1789683 RepID=A0A1X7R3U2_9SACH|nr:similar to Saccharomyces cerevisiae YIL126W STH1 ATPase component of the RSC chromatin remodeling complex [Kazachstania saulgeensis]
MLESTGAVVATPNTVLPNSNGEDFPKEESKVPQPIITIPKPTSSEQLEQLIYRYKIISHNPKENELEINSIETLLSKLSKDQDIFNEDLEKIRNNISANRHKPYDGNLLSKQLLALQLLEKDIDIPENLLTSKLTSITEDLSITNKNDSKSLEVLKIFGDFNKTIKNFDLENQFRNTSPSQLGDPEIESTISSQIAKRIAELERLPANLGTYSLDDCLEFITKDDLPSGIDTLKIKALVELKCLKLLTKQKSLRQKIITNTSTQAHHNIPYLRDSPFTLAAQRSVQVRGKVIVPQTARIAEELERQQLLEKRKKERNIHMKRINGIRDAIQEAKDSNFTRRDRCAQFGKLMLSTHNQIEKEEQRRIERNAKQRLAALKSNDEEAYLKLLDQTKDTRITQLLGQTNSFLDSLASAVRVQQNEAKIARGEEITVTTDEEREKIDYYEVAHTIKEKVEKQPSILVGGSLKEYQLKGLEWMVSLYNNHLNGILADEMGLGKTIQSISLITYLFEEKKNPGPYLVIVPLSTITNWTLEFEKWAPSLNTIVYKGTPNQRRALQYRIRNGDFDVLLTTYEYIIKDRAMLCKHEWAHMIIDEGHRMKNAQSKLSYTIQHYYKTRNRLILTGTPLQNNLPELWALLNFVLPKIFNSASTFDDWFNTPFANTGGQEKLELTEEETLLIIRRLHKVLRPFLLRRLKKEVEKDLPDKVETVVKCKLSGLQQTLYEQMLKHNALFVGAGTEGATKTGIKGLNNKIMQLRKICNHPFVFDEVEGVINPSRGNSDLLYRVSGKFELLDRVLPKFKATGHRVLMFFQMTQVMDIMEDFLRMRNLKYMRLDGSTKADERTDMLKLFNQPDSDYFCFLLSTRAGGLGLNLQTADTVVIFDTDWNPHQDLQAQDRAHRIGQKNEVRILRLITTDSVEEVILERAMQKLDIDGKVIQAGKFDNKSTAEEQEAFLRRLIENESTADDDDKAELDDEELNEVLARSEDEKILFNKMDKDRLAEEKADAKTLGLKTPLSRLITKDELPEVFTEDIEKHLHVEPVALSRMRQTKRVYYDDGLTEEQFLDAVENEESTLEETIQKKREQREKRMRNKMEKITDEDGEIPTLENTPEMETIPSEEPENVEPTTVEKDEEDATISGRRRRTRKRKTVGNIPESVVQIENETSVPEDTETIVEELQEEPQKKKQKFKVTLKLKKPTPEINQKDEVIIEDGTAAKPTPKKRGRKSTKKTDIAAEDAKTGLNIPDLVVSLMKELHAIVDKDDGHACTDVFEKLPSKKLYPDYYVLISNPTAIDTITKKAKKNGYQSLGEVKEDIETMYSNAKFYNEKGSWVYNDADTLKKFTDKWFKANE